MFQQWLKYFRLSDYACESCLDLGQAIWRPDLEAKPAKLAYDWSYLRRPFNQVHLSDVLRGEGRDCKGCKIILRILEPYRNQLQGAGMFVYLAFAENIDILVTPAPQHEPSNWYMQRILGIRKIPEGSVTLSSSPEHPISVEPGSLQSAVRVLSWLNECVNTHKLCRSRTDSIFPTRVLFVQGPTTVSLYEPEQEKAEYVCLSHCWGGASFLQTTKSNLKQHLAQIPWIGLPKTFQDAISFTWALRIKYIWIDSLCQWISAPTQSRYQLTSD